MAGVPGLQQRLQGWLLPPPAPAAADGGPSTSGDDSTDAGSGAVIASSSGSPATSSGCGGDTSGGLPPHDLACLHGDRLLAVFKRHGVQQLPIGELLHALRGAEGPLLRFAFSMLDCTGDIPLPAQLPAAAPNAQLLWLCGNPRCLNLDGASEQVYVCVGRGERGRASQQGRAWQLLHTGLRTVQHVLAVLARSAFRSTMGYGGGARASAAKRACVHVCRTCIAASPVEPRLPTSRIPSFTAWRRTCRGCTAQAATAYRTAASAARPSTGARGATSARARQHWRGSRQEAAVPVQRPLGIPLNTVRPRAGPKNQGACL